MSLNLGSAHAATTRTLRDGGIGTPALDARVLLASATGLSIEALIAKGNDPLTPEAELRLARYVSRRLSGEPVSRIKGVREFYARDFQIDPYTLDPRADTETLIAAALKNVARCHVQGRPLTVLDLGTGSGCILITLLAELPQARGVGFDISPGALRLARANAERLGVGARARFAAANWFDGLSGRFDIIVSNPPYIASAEIESLSPEVAQHDPRTALDGGTDGLDAYRRIANGTARFLHEGGCLLVEIGSAQAEAVAGLFREAGLTVARDGIVADLAGRPRCICAKISHGEGARNVGSS